MAENGDNKKKRGDQTHTDDASGKTRVYRELLSQLRSLE